MRPAWGFLVLCALAAPVAGQGVPVTWDAGAQGWTDPDALATWDATAGYQGSGGMILPVGVTRLEVGLDLHLPLSGFRLLVRPLDPDTGLPCVTLEARVPRRALACIPGCLRMIYPTVCSGRSLGDGWFEYKFGPGIVVGSPRLCGGEPLTRLIIDHESPVAVDLLDTCPDGVRPIGLQELRPAQGSSSGGTPVIISGDGFAPGLEVFFGSVSARARVLSSQTLLVVSPPAGRAGPVDVTALNPDGGRATLAGGFRYGPPVDDPVVSPPGRVVNPLATDLRVDAGEVLGGGLARIAFARVQLGGPLANAQAVDLASGQDVTVRASLGADGLVVFAGEGAALRIQDGPPQVGAVVPGSVSPDVVTCLSITGLRLAGAYAAAIETPSGRVPLVGQPRVNAEGTRLNGLCLPEGVPPGAYDLLVSTPVFPDAPSGGRVVVTFPVPTGADEGIFRRDASLAPDSLSGSPYAVFRGRAGFTFKSSVLGGSRVTVRLLLRQNATAAGGVPPRVRLLLPGVPALTSTHTAAPDTWQEHRLDVTPPAAGVLRIRVECEGADAAHETYLDDIRVEQERGLLDRPSGTSGPVRQTTAAGTTRAGAAALALAAGHSHTLGIAAGGTVRVSFQARAVGGAGASAVLRADDGSWSVPFAPEGPPDAEGWQRYVATSPALGGPTLLELELSASGSSGELYVDEVDVRGP